MRFTSAAFNPGMQSENRLAISLDVASGALDPHPPNTNANAHTPTSRLMS